MLEVELTNGATAHVRDIDDVERGDIRAVFTNADKDGAKISGTELSMGTFGAIQDAVMVQFVDSWTVKDRKTGRPLPIDLKSVKRMRLRDYNRLIEALQPLLNEVMSGEQQAAPDPTSEDNSSTSDDTDSVND